MLPSFAFSFISLVDKIWKKVHEKLWEKYFLWATAEDSVMTGQWLQAECQQSLTIHVDGRI